ncbi:MAG: carboxymuconolactone decarboxylase family protein [Deltaproteobacteria bacterium]
MAKLPDPVTPLTPEAQEVYDELVSSRGALHGPYRSLIHHPELARRVGSLGSFLRFGNGALPGNVRELLILTVARKIDSPFEWVMHTPHALKEGLPEDVIESIRQNKEPSVLSPLQADALKAARCVFDRRSIPKDLQERLIEAAGIKGLIELVVLAGFYQMIGEIISSFDTPLPEGASDPFAGSARFNCERGRAT